MKRNDPKAYYALKDYISFSFEHLPAAQAAGGPMPNMDVHGNEKKLSGFWLASRYTSFKVLLDYFRQP